jgi:hypothetical protein
MILRTPNPTLDIPTKRWQGLVKAWRTQLHFYDSGEYKEDTLQWKTCTDAPSSSTEEGGDELEGQVEYKEEEGMGSSLFLEDDDLYSKLGGDGNERDRSDRKQVVAPGEEDFNGDVKKEGIKPDVKRRWADDDSDSDDDLL